MTFVIFKSSGGRELHFRHIPRVGEYVKIMIEPVLEGIVRGVSWTFHPPKTKRPTKPKPGESLDYSATVEIILQKP